MKNRLFARAKEKALHAEGFAMIVSARSRR
jgi:hypothetical protein